MTKRQEAALLTKQKLIASAKKLLKEKNLSDIQVETITKEAGVAKGTFYIYFKKKEDIIFETTTPPFIELAELFKSDKKNDFKTKFYEYLYNFMKDIESYGIETTREWIKGAVKPTGTTKDNNKWAFDFDTLKDVLEFSVSKGELKKDTPVELLTHIIISELYGMMTVWCISDSQFKPTEWIKKFYKEQIEVILQKYIKENK